jgi:hypothetical protein
MSGRVEHGGPGEKRLADQIGPCARGREPDLGRPERDRHRMRGEDLRDVLHFAETVDRDVGTDRAARRVPDGERSLLRTVRMDGDERRADHVEREPGTDDRRVEHIGDLIGRSPEPIDRVLVWDEELVRAGDEPGKVRLHMERRTGRVVASRVAGDEPGFHVLVELHVLRERRPRGRVGAERDLVPAFVREVHVGERRDEMRGHRMVDVFDVRPTRGGVGGGPVDEVAVAEVRRRESLPADVRDREEVSEPGGVRLRDRRVEISPERRRVRRAGPPSLRVRVARVVVEPDRPVRAVVVTLREERRLDR